MKPCLGRAAAIGWFFVAHDSESASLAYKNVSYCHNIHLPDGFDFETVCQKPPIYLTPIIYHKYK